MKEERAIEIMSNFTFSSNHIESNDVNEAVKQSIEALGQIRQIRAYLLLGEMAEGDLAETDKRLGPMVGEAERTLLGVRGFKMPIGDLRCLVDRLRKEYPGIDIDAECKAWAARKLSDPLTKKSRPSGQVWNWIRKAEEFRKERDGTHKGYSQESTAEGLQRSVGAPID